MLWLGRDCDSSVKYQSDYWTNVHIEMDYLFADNQSSLIYLYTIYSFKVERIFNCSITKPFESNPPPIGTTSHGTWSYHTWPKILNLSGRFLFHCYYVKYYELVILKNTNATWYCLIIGVILDLNYWQDKNEVSKVRS